MDEEVVKNELWLSCDKVSLKEIILIIKENLNSCARNFVSIGYYLKNIRDKELFLDNGYQSLWELAQSEFGISKSQASKFMSINDKFSVDGNTPALLEKYKEFSSSKLSEMLYLSDEQIEQVTLANTVVEIREIRNPEKAISISKQEEDVQETPLSTKLTVFEEAAKLIRVPEVNKRILNDITKWCIDKLKDTLQLQIEVHGFDSSMQHLLILNLQKNVTVVVNNYSIMFGKGYITITDHEFDLVVNLLYLDIDQEIHRIWYEVVPAGQEKSSKDASFFEETDDSEPDEEPVSSEPKKSNWEIGIFENDTAGYGYSRAMIVGDLIKKLVSDDVEINSINGDYCESHGREYFAYIVNGYVEFEDESSNFSFKVDIDRFKNEYEQYKERFEPMPDPTKDEGDEDDDTDDVPCRSCKYDTMNPDEYLNDHPGATLPCIACDDKFESWRPKDFEEEVEPVKESEEIETVEADIIQEEPKSDEPINTLSLTKELLKAKQSSLDSVIYTTRNVEKSIAELKYIEKCKIMVGALKGYVSDLDNKPLPKQEQPELPILKNNDQRKDFIDAYSSWPVWIDTAETGERYHRYNLTDTVAMVVKVSLKHSHVRYEETKSFEYGSEQYYLVGVKAEWGAKGSQFKEDAGRTFYECSTNKSALIEYLKEFQKGKVK